MAYEKPVDYKEVPERIADLKAKHPDARLRPVDPAKPFDIVTVDGKTFVVYAAACYRDENDALPGIGVAWEPFPGRTPYTKDSELMNAETSAWGRAIVAALRSESKSIASAEEVRNRRAEQEAGEPSARTTTRRAPVPHDPETGEVRRASPNKPASPKQIGMLKGLAGDLGLEPADLKAIIDTALGRETGGWKDLSSADASLVIDQLKKYRPTEEHADHRPEEARDQYDAGLLPGEEPF